MASVNSQPDILSQAESSRALRFDPGERKLLRVWLRLFLFFLPTVVLIAPVVYSVDPFARFAKPSIVPDSIRAGYGVQLNQTLWKLPTYNRDPKPNILLGDSETARLPDKLISDMTGERYANLAYGGGTLREAISTFWFASKRTHLRRVFFGLSFMEYNAYPRDRVIQAEEMVRNPALYFLNSDVLEATTYDIADAYFHHHTYLIPQVDRDVFWTSQIKYLEAYYKRETDPGSLRDEMKKIVAYCQAQGISIVFLITPQHMDAQRQIGALGVENRYQQFKNDLRSMAPVYDCDIDTDFTRDKNNYSDPFHLTDSAAKQLVADLWSGNLKWCLAAAAAQ